MNPLKKKEVTGKPCAWARGHPWTIIAGTVFELQVATCMLQWWWAQTFHLWKICPRARRSPPHKTSSKLKHEGFCIVPDNNIKEKLIIGFNNLRSLNSGPIINEQLVIAIAAVFATAKK